MFPKPRAKTRKRLTPTTAIAYLAVSAFTLSVLLPFIHELAKSLSYPTAVDRGAVVFVPHVFTLGNYEYFFRKFLEPLGRAFLNSLFLVFAGGALSILASALFAFPLSRSKSEFRIGGALIMMLVCFIVLQRPLIPLRMTVQALGLLDSLWAVLLNQLMVPFMLIMIITFFRTIPEELYESARIDGANDLQLFRKITLPLSTAILVTIFLMQAVAYWNVFLQAKLFLLNTYLYPIQLFIGSIMKGGGDVLQGSMNSRDPFAESESTKSALTIMASIPICTLYLFLQKYFAKGLMEGSIKG